MSLLGSSELFKGYAANGVEFSWRDAIFFFGIMDVE